MLALALSPPPRRNPSPYLSNSPTLGVVRPLKALLSCPQCCEVWCGIGVTWCGVALHAVWHFDAGYCGVCVSLCVTMCYCVTPLHALWHFDGGNCGNQPNPLRALQCTAEKGAAATKREPNEMSKLWCGENIFRLKWIYEQVWISLKCAHSKGLPGA